MPLPYFRFSELSRYPDVLDLLAMNSRGRVWLVGGFLFRSLAGLPSSIPDIDVVVERRRPDLKLLPGWTCTVNSFGGQKLTGPSLALDFIEADKFQPCARRGLKFSPEALLRLVPLTIQALVFDVSEGALSGDVGLHAIATKTVGVNNGAEALRYCLVKGISLREFVGTKARSLGFRPVP